MHFKNVNNCLYTNIYSYLESSGGQSSNLYLNVGSFFQHQCKLDICGNLRQLFCCIGAYYVLFYCTELPGLFNLRKLGWYSQKYLQTTYDHYLAVAAILYELFELFKKDRKMIVIS